MNTTIPTKEQNPKGLHQRYIVTHADDTKDDPEALYFVLKLNSKDPVHKRACRKAAWAYVDEIRRSSRLPLLPAGDHTHPLYSRPTEEQIRMAKDLEQLLIKTQDDHA